MFFTLADGVHLNTISIALIVLIVFIQYLNAKKTKNCYQKLGISTDATERQIKKSFRKLALKYHPDKANDENREKHEAIFKELAHCYQLLSDEDQRAMYDANGYRENNGGGGGAHFNQESFSDIFSRFFGRGNSFGFDDMFSGGSGAGGSSGFHFSSSSSNSGGGAGFDPFASFGGGGGGHGQQQQQRRQQYPNMNRQQQHRQQRQQRQQHRPPSAKKELKKQSVFVDLEDIVYDDTSKMVDVEVCRMDRRHREKCREETVELLIPKGCPEGHQIKKKKHGYIFEIFTNKHEIFERGNKLHRSDLFIQQDMYLHDALLGFDLEIMSIDGELIQVTVPEMPVNQQYTIERKGLPRFTAKETTVDNRGHLIIKFNILYPILNEQQKSALQNVFDEDNTNSMPLNEMSGWNYDEAIAYQKKEQKKKDRRQKSRNRNRNRNSNNEKTEL